MDAPALVGPVWAVEDVDGLGVLDAAFPTLEFTADGRVAGTTGLNRCMGPYSMTGDTLTIGPLMTTRMAGPEAVMVQEQRFLAALEGSIRVHIDEGMVLHLEGAGHHLRLKAMRADPEL
jgi:heat shock protein HslJ